MAESICGAVAENKMKSECMCGGDTWDNRQIESSSATAHVILPLMISSSLELGSVINILSNNPRVTEIGDFERTSWVVSAVI